MRMIAQQVKMITAHAQFSTLVNDRFRNLKNGKF